MATDLSQSCTLIQFKLYIINLTNHNNRSQVPKVCPCRVGKWTHHNCRWYIILADNNKLYSQSKLDTLSAPIHGFQLPQSLTAVTET